MNPSKTLNRLAALAVSLAALPLMGQDGVEFRDAQAAQLRADKSYQLQVLDQISVRVYDEPELAMTQRIDGDGNVKLPLLEGTITLAGMTLRAAERYIERLYVEQRILKDPRVMLQIAAYSPKEIQIFGEIGREGILTFPTEINSLDIVDVIARAGGFSPTADDKNVRVSRTLPDGRLTTFEINVRDLIRGKKDGERVQSVPIYPGDLIWVDDVVF